MNKKGSMMSVIAVLVLLGMSIMGIVAGYAMFSDSFSELRPVVSEHSAANDTLTTGETLLESLDYIGLSILMALVIGIIILSFMIDVHPVFFVGAIILSIISILVSVPLSNGYMHLITQVGAESSFTMTTFIMQYLPYITAIICMMSMIVIYAGKRVIVGGTGL